MKKRIVLIVFLLMLFIVPAVLVPSSSAVYGDESPQSITSFSETLPDDTLFYADGLDFYAYDYSYTLQDFDGESGDITDTYTDDSSVHAIFWSVTDVGEWWKYVYYKIDNQSLGLHHVDLCFLPDSCNNYSVSYWNGMEYVEYVNEADIGLVSITDWELEADVLILRLGVYTNKTSPSGVWVPSVQVDYIHDQFMTLESSSHYVESFADVSDWTLHVGSNSPASDGDRMYWDIPGDSGWDYLKTNSPSLAALADNYIEIRLSANVSGPNCEVQTYQQDNEGGGSAGSLAYGTIGALSTTAKIAKGLLSNAPIESMYILCRSSVAARIYFDYLHIGPADEMGWQHDGSTTQGVEVGAGSGGTMSTDGDLLSLTADADGSTFDFYSDTSTTKTGINPNYYPFLHINLNSSDIDSGAWIRVQGYTTTWLNLMAAQDITTADIFINLRASTSADYGIFRIWSYGSQTIHVNYIKAYSIANYTITQSGSCATSDYMYVSGGALVVSKSTAYYMILDHDPTISVSDTYPVYNISTSWTDSNPSSNSDFWFEMKVSSWGSALWDATRGPTDSGTLTDFKISVYYSMSISAIKFIDTRMWQVVDSVSVWFIIPFDYWAFNVGLIFLGLILVIASTCIFALWIRNRSISRDKLFLFLVLFMLGWGLFLGGAMLS